MRLELYRCLQGKFQGDIKIYLISNVGIFIGLALIIYS